MAADGISRVLVLLTGLAAVAGILFSWDIELRTNEFFAFFLALIGGVYGVFLSFDLFLLFVFYEIAIVPKYFLISIWGSTRREYAAMKLALYSFVGSSMVLIGLLAAYAPSPLRLSICAPWAELPADAIQKAASRPGWRVLQGGLDTVVPPGPSLAALPEAVPRTLDPQGSHDFDAWINRIADWVQASWTIFQEG